MFDYLIRLLSKSRFLGWWFWYINKEDSKNIEPAVLRRIILLDTTSHLAFIFLVFYGFFHIGVLLQTSVGELELLLAGLVVVILLFIRSKQFKSHFSATYRVFLFAMILLLTLLMASGGSYNTGIFWWFVFPPTALFMAKKREGLFWVAILFAIGLTIITLDQFFQIELTPYKPEQIINILISLSVLSIVSFAYQNQLEKDEQNLVQEKKELSMIIENMPIGVLLIHAKTDQITVSNAAAVQLLGPEMTQISVRHHKKIKTLLTGERKPYPTKELPLYLASHTGKVIVKSGIFIKDAFGNLTEIRYTALPIFDQSKKIGSIIVILEDISKEQIAYSLTQDESIPVSSHNLRTPLTGIKWFSDLLIRGKAGKINPTQKDYLEQISQSNDRMIALIEDILNAQARLKTKK